MITATRGLRLLITHALTLGCIQLAWSPDGDHSFKPRKKSGRTQEQNWEEALEWIVQFVQCSLHHPPSGRVEPQRGEGD